MKTLTLSTVLLALFLVACGGESAVVSEPGSSESTTAGSPDAGGVLGLRYARRFELAETYVHQWRADGAPVRQGWLLVLDVDPALVQPRNELEPVLYAGDQTLERVNSGHHSGRVVAVLPAPQDTELATLPLWFGAPELPERLTAASIADARRAAEAAGVVPFDARTVASAESAGGPELVLESRDQLHREAARLIQRYSPDETEFANGMLAPEVR
jgi:hypothetical protein